METYKRIASVALRRAVLQLLRAHEYAVDAETDVWQFAIEWRHLKRMGVVHNDLRWLFTKRLIECRHELSSPNSLERSFEEYRTKLVTADSALVLTGDGVEFFKESLDEVSSDEEEPDPNQLANGVADETQMKADHRNRSDRPYWDPDHGELWFQGDLVKRFHQPAPNQTKILSAFEEEGWPEFILDPLSQTQTNPHRRLLTTVKSLNNCQLQERIRFHTNGGEKVFWEPVPG